jgi:hypothetical protein
MVLSKLNKPGLVLSLLAFMVAVFAQQDVINKPFEKWTREDAESILNSSPWAAHSELRLRFDQERQSAAGSYTPEAGVTDTSAKNAQTTVSSDIPVDFVFTARLRSALPIRQALSRLKQLQLDTKMSEKDRATLETQIKGLIECPACASNYVITLSSKSVNRPGSDAVYTTFKGGRLSDLQRYVFIANDRGERRPLVHFVPPKVPGDEAIFFFPRLDEKGAPLLTPDNKELVINLTDNRANAITNFKFDVSKLVLNSKVEF